MSPKHFEIPHTVVLDYPITLGKNEEIKEIVFPRRMKVSDMTGISDTLPNIDRIVKMASRITGQFQKVFEEMDAVDIRKISDVIESFLPNSPETGDVV